MENRLLNVSRQFAKLPDTVHQHRHWLWVLITLVSLVCAYGVITKTRMDMRIDSFFDQQDPAIAALNNFRSQFGSDDSVYLVYEAADGDVFSRASLEAVAALTEQLEQASRGQLDDAGLTEGQRQELMQIRRVQSPSNLRIQTAEGDTLLAERLLPSPLPESPGALQTVRETALAEPDFVNAFYSDDSRYGALMISTTLGAQPVDDYEPAVNSEDIQLDDMFSDFGNASDSFELSFSESATVEDVEFEPVDINHYAAFHDALRQVYQPFDQTLNFYATGNPPLQAWVADILQQMIWLALAMIAVFICLLRMLFRSFSAVIWPIVTIAISLLWTWGITAWLGATLSTMISLTVMLVFAVGLADCIHVMTAYYQAKRHGQEHQAALSTAYEKTGLAILLTTLTTMVGVLALTFSDMLPIRVFAMMSALGVLLAFVFSVVLLPLLLSLWHPPAERNTIETLPASSLLGRSGWVLAGLALITAVLALLVDVLLSVYLLALVGFAWLVLVYQDVILSRCLALSARFPKAILAAFIGFFILAAYGTSQMQIDSNIAELTSEDSEPRIAYDIVDQHMAGAQTLSVMIDTGESDGVMQPELLNAMDQFQQHVENTYAGQVSRTYSLANIVKDTYQVMNQDDPAWHRLPEDFVTVSQLLYLFGSADPEERRNLVSDDYSRTHITMNAYNAGSYEYQQFFRQLENDIDQYFAPAYDRLPEMDISVTGSVPLMMRAMDSIARSQYSSLMLALGVITLMMCLTLGSWQAGLVAAVPNLLPAVTTFGIMGLLDIPLDTDTLLIAPMIIGIAVDDTIHFLTHYRLALAETQDMNAALTSTVKRVGRAVMFTTLVLSLGFIVLSFSDYLGVAKIGIFGALAIVVALLCDLLLLPALLRCIKPRLGLKLPVSDFAKPDYSSTPQEA
ncbi:efflux RND transporter permease subunit [Pseudohongiella nitratireducens]|uniref:efflux RND transporter permease subunit n=1 Tax=Pseudohongiella nitratireducens TaxID=1768907 RepID=UPI0030EDBD68